MSDLTAPLNVISSVHNPSIIEETSSDDKHGALPRSKRPHRRRKLPSRCPASLIPRVGLGLQLIIRSPVRLLSYLVIHFSKWFQRKFFPSPPYIYIPPSLTTKYPLATDELSNLWTSSHLTYDKQRKEWKDEYLEKGPGGGEISRRYLAICSRIQQLTFTRTIKLMCEGKVWLMVWDMVINVSRGLSGPAGIWLFERLVDEAHGVFSGRVVNNERLLWLTAGSVR